STRSASGAVVVTAAIIGRGKSTVQNRGSNRWIQSLSCPLRLLASQKAMILFLKIGERAPHGAGDLPRRALERGGRVAAARGGELDRDAHIPRGLHGRGFDASGRGRHEHFGPALADDERTAWRDRSSRGAAWEPEQRA